MGLRPIRSFSFDPKLAPILLIFLGPIRQAQCHLPHHTRMPLHTSSSQHPSTRMASLSSELTDSPPRLRAHQPAFTPAWLCCHAQPRPATCLLLHEPNKAAHVECIFFSSAWFFFRPCTWPSKWSLGRQPSTCFWHISDPHSSPDFSTLQLELLQS